MGVQVEQVEHDPQTSSIIGPYFCLSLSLTVKGECWFSWDSTLIKKKKEGISLKLITFPLKVMEKNKSVVFRKSPLIK
jgi:hypothetical protein